MLIKACLPCKFHVIKRNEEGQSTFCQKENCWAQYSKCVVYKALDRFLNDEFIKPNEVSQFYNQIHADKK